MNKLDYDVYDAGLTPINPSEWNKLLGKSKLTVYKSWPNEGMSAIWEDGDLVAISIAEWVGKVRENGKRDIMTGCFKLSKIKITK